MWGDDHGCLSLSETTPYITSPNNKCVPCNPGEDWMNSGPVRGASVKHEYWGSMQYILKIKPSLKPIQSSKWEHCSDSDNSMYEWMFP